MYQNIYNQDRASEQASKLENHSVWFSCNFISLGCVKFELCRIKCCSDGVAMVIWYV